MNHRSAQTAKRGTKAFRRRRQRALHARLRRRFNGTLPVFKSGRRARKPRPTPALLASHKKVVATPAAPMANAATGVQTPPVDLSQGIEVLELDTTPFGCLKRAGIHTLADLIGKTAADLLDIRNFGGKSRDKVKERLAGMGLSLKEA